MRSARLASRVPLAAIACALALACARGEDGDTAHGADAAPLSLAQTIALPGVNGRIDHLALDAKRRLLHVAALGNGSLEVVSLEKGERTRSVPSLDEPQGVEFAPEADRVAVACGGDGAVILYDGSDLERRTVVDLGGDADNVHWDAAAKRLLVAYGSGGIASIDPTAAKVESRVELGSHPEGFALESAGPRAFVNLASRGVVAVVDRKAGKRVATWSLGGASSNCPMALDERAKRLYVGCRAPSRLVVLSTGDGAIVASVGLSGDPDDVFLDVLRHRAYVTCGAGTIDVFDVAAPQGGDETSPSRVDAAPAGVPLRLSAHVPTVRGARTALLDAATGTLYVAVPRRGTEDAEIRAYEPR